MSLVRDSFILGLRAEGYNSDSSLSFHFLDCFNTHLVDCNTDCCTVDICIGYLFCLDKVCFIPSSFEISSLRIWTIFKASVIVGTCLAGKQKLLKPIRSPEGIDTIK